MLKKFFSKYSDLQKLKMSVSFGWIVAVGLLLIAPTISALNGSHFGSEFFYGLLFTGFILSIRYSMMKPILRAAGGGAKAIGIVYILESLFSRRSGGSATLGAFVGAMLVILLLLIKNAVISIYLLIRETVTLIRMVNTGEQSVILEHAATKE